jgi:hypothetical protein
MHITVYPEEPNHEKLTFSEVEIMAHFVRPGWVKRYYKVSHATVYRAIWEGRLRAIKTRDGAYLIDTRTLPKKLGR